MIYIDAIHYSVRDNGVIRKLAAYVILGLTCDGHKEVLSLSVGENESSKYWLNVLNELKKRGVKDIMVICVDGLTGIKEAINAAFPKEVFSQAITETGAESTVKCALCRSAVCQTNPHKKSQPTEFTE